MLTFLFDLGLVEANRDREATGLRKVEKIKIVLDRKVCTSILTVDHYHHYISNLFYFNKLITLTLSAQRVPKICSQIFSQLHCFQSG
jgi:hypothetical protein